MLSCCRLPCLLRSPSTLQPHSACVEPAGSGDASRPVCQRRPPASDVFPGGRDSSQNHRITESQNHRLTDSSLALVLQLSARLQSQRPALHNAAVQRLRRRGITQPTVGAAGGIFSAWSITAYSGKQRRGGNATSLLAHPRPTRDNRDPARHRCPRAAGPQASPLRTHAGVTPLSAQSPSSFCSAPRLRE